MYDPKEILNRELTRLRRFAYALTGNHADADDLVHDLVVKVLEKGLPARNDPVPWLITVCKNLWLDKVRRAGVVTRAVGTLSSEGSDMNSDTTISEVHLMQVVSSLQHLSEDQRLALTMVTIQGLSYEETATMLDVPIGTIMSRVCRARASLLEYLGEKNA